ncbi:VOC family protein [Chloroflexota bacterium]
MPNYSYDHIHLFSPDPLKTSQFYEEMFNAKMVSKRELADGRVSVELDLNGARVLVAQGRAQAESSSVQSGLGYGLDHFGIQTDNLEAAVAGLKARGIEFRDEIREIRPGLKISFFWGPENVLIELMERST